MKITPGVTWTSGATVNHTQLNNFLTNASITSGALDQVALGENALDSLTSGTDNVGIGDNAGTALTDGHSNVIIGNDALVTADSAYNNVAIGENAMKLGSGSPAQNVAIGVNALIDLAGEVGSGQSYSNVAIGQDAAANVTTGTTNVMIGSSSGALLTTDSSTNVLVGNGAMGSASAAVDAAVAVGAEALKVNTADLNVGVGYKAGVANTSGVDNTYVGSQAGYTNITGTDNTFIGDNAGYYVTGSNNTAVGSAAFDDSGAAAYTNTTAIGFNASPSASNEVVLGDGNVTIIRSGSDDSCDLGSASNRFDDVYATNNTIQTSDKNLKKNIKKTNLGLAFLEKLRPVSYSWKTGKRKHYGFIAQEVEKALDGEDFGGLVKGVSGDGGYYGLRYNEFIGPLVKAVQELAARVAKLEGKA